jgi:hypothetical protein
MTTVVVMADGLSEHHCRGNGHFNVSDEHRRTPLVDRHRGVTKGRAVFRPDPYAARRFDPNFGRKFSRPGIERLKRGGK